MKYALYYHNMCPFCLMVLRDLPKVSVDVEKRDVMRHPAYRQEQKKATGRTTVPCLLIENEQGEKEWMYESSDIVRFLKSR